MANHQASREALTEAVKLLQMLDARENEPIHRYNPYTPQRHEKQIAFHLLPIDKSVRVLMGGNQSGKTTAGCAEVVWHTTGEYPEWYPKDLRMTQPAHWRIGAVDFENAVGKLIEPRLLDLIPPRLIHSTHRNSTGVITTYNLTNGSTISILTYEQFAKMPNIWEGWVGHGAWFDEPPPRGAYIATERGLIAKQGRLLITMTPIEADSIWVKDELIDSFRQWVGIVEANIFDNPYLSKERVAMFQKTLDPSEIEARIFGKFTSIMGRIYLTFSLNVHRVKPFEIPAHWPVYAALDPHDAKPFVMIWACVDPNGRVFIFDEAPQESWQDVCAKDPLTLSDFVSMVEEKEEGRRMIRRAIDPNYGNVKRIQGGKTLQQELADRGLVFDFVNDSLAIGHTIVREALRYDTERPVNDDNSPSLHVFSTCHNTIQSLMKYGKDKNGEVVDSIWKDFSDVVRYLMMLEPIWMPPKASRRPELSPQSNPRTFANVPLTTCEIPA